MTMKFLLNMNIPRSLNQLLSEAGYTARHVADIGLATALDANIVAEARKHSEIILTPEYLEFL